MQYELLGVEELAIDPRNVRRHYADIRDLAESIFQHGLLQNLVVRPDEETQKYIVKSGNRRLKAILLLMEQGRWPPERHGDEEKLLCLVVDEGGWEQMVENLIRKNVPAWEMGARMIELVEAGFTQETLTGKLNISRGSVSNYIRIAKGIHPEIVMQIERTGNDLSIMQLLQLSKLVDDNSYRPNLKAQQQMLDSFLEFRRRKKQSKSVTVSSMGEKDRMYQRFRSLVSGGIPVPAHAQPFLHAIMDYLLGTTTKLLFPPPSEGR